MRKSGRGTSQNQWTGPKFKKRKRFALTGTANSKTAWRPRNAASLSSPRVGKSLNLDGKSVCAKGEVTTWSTKLRLQDFELRARAWLRSWKYLDDKLGGFVKKEMNTLRLHHIKPTQTNKNCQFHQGHDPAYLVAVIR